MYACMRACMYLCMNECMHDVVQAHTGAVFARHVSRGRGYVRSLLIRPRYAHTHTHPHTPDPSLYSALISIPLCFFAYTSDDTSDLCQHMYLDR